jgi:hypothetical protein
MKLHLMGLYTLMQKTIGEVKAASLLALNLDEGKEQMQY